MQLMSNWLPGSLLGRITLIMVVGLLATELGSFYLHLQERAGMMGGSYRHAGHGWASLPAPFLWLLALTATSILAASLLAIHWAARPLQDLAAAATAFASDLDAASLPETGPTEVRRAAVAFNDMQGRLRKLVVERGRALAAVSHDLRTPLTRMRLRAELVQDTALREKLDADIDDMTGMVDGVLAYLRGIEAAEPARPIDMVALVQSIAEDARALGHDVRWLGNAADDASSAPFVGRLSVLRRAVTNLVDNAIAHGHVVTLALQETPGCASIVVEDDGPGIPLCDRQRATEPFVRLDEARSTRGGGMGLGLAIARDAAALHGGELILANRPEGGLRATLLLPRATARTR